MNFIVRPSVNDVNQYINLQVWMLARMCQLENKIYAVGEPSYRYVFYLHLTFSNFNMWHQSVKLF